MASPFFPLLGNLNSLGFFQFLFPFLLILAIAYGGLEFGLGGGGEKTKRIMPKSANGLIALIIAFFVMNYSGGVGTSIAVFFSQLFGQGMIVAVGILLVLLLIGLFGIRPSDLHDKPKRGITAIAGVIILVVFAIFVSSGNSLGLTGLNLDNNFWTIVIFLLILVVVMWVLSRDGKGGGKKE